MEYVIRSNPGDVDIDVLLLTSSFSTEISEGFMKIKYTFFDNLIYLSKMCIWYFERLSTAKMRRWTWSTTMPNFKFLSRTVSDTDRQRETSKCFYRGSVFSYCGKKHSKQWINRKIVTWLPCFQHWQTNGNNTNYFIVSSVCTEYNFDTIFNMAGYVVLKMYFFLST